MERLVQVLQGTMSPDSQIRNQSEAYLATYLIEKNAEVALLTFTELALKAPNNEAESSIVQLASILLRQALEKFNASVLDQKTRSQPNVSIRQAVHDMIYSNLYQLAGFRVQTAIASVYVSLFAKTDNWEALCSQLKKICDQDFENSQAIALRCASLATLSRIESENDVALLIKNLTPLLGYYVETFEVLDVALTVIRSMTRLFRKLGYSFQLVDKSYINYWQCMIYHYLSKQSSYPWYFLCEVANLNAILINAKGIDYELNARLIYQLLDRVVVQNEICTEQVVKFDSDTGNPASLELMCCATLQIVSRFPPSCVNVAEVMETTFCVSEITPRIANLFWNDPNEFVAETYDTFSSSLSARHAAVDLIDSLIDSMESDVVRQCFALCASSRLDPANSPDSERYQSRLEAAIWLCGNLRDTMIEDQDASVKSFIPKELFVNVIETAFRCPTASPLIRASVLWLLGCPNCLTMEMKPKVVEYAYNELLNPSGHLAVLVFCCRIIAVNYAECVNKIRIDTSGLLNQLIRLLDETNEDTSHIVLETFKAIIKQETNGIPLGACEILPTKLIQLWENGGDSDPFLRDEIVMLFCEFLEGGHPNLTKYAMNAIRAFLKDSKQRANSLSLYTLLLQSTKCEELENFAKTFFPNFFDYVKEFNYNDSDEVREISRCFAEHLKFHPDTTMTFHFYTVFMSQVKDKDFEQCSALTSSVISYFKAAEDIDHLKLVIGILTTPGVEGLLHEEAVITAICRIIVPHDKFEFIGFDSGPAVIQALVDRPGMLFAYALIKLLVALDRGIPLSEEAKHQIKTYLERELEAASRSTEVKASDVHPDDAEQFLWNGFDKDGDLRSTDDLTGPDLQLAKETIQRVLLDM